jgi:hypothetical protein
MAWVDWPCGTTTIIGEGPRGPRAPTAAEAEDHERYCAACRSKDGA